MITHFLSGGCSFSETPTPGADNWPWHVEHYLQVPAIHTGRQRIGNNYIYKRVVHELSKIENKENLLVGIMWTAAHRQTFYNRKDLYLKTEKTLPQYTRVPEERRDPLVIAGEKAHYTAHPADKWEYSKFYYNYFFDEISCYIDTIQYILYLQWYFKLHNIKYFMTRFSNYVLPDHDASGDLKNHPDIKYLYDQIDFSNWLNFYSMNKFCEESGLPYKSSVDRHPTTLQNKLFTEQIIIPHLKDKGYVN